MKTLVCLLSVVLFSLSCYGKAMLVVQPSAVMAHLYAIPTGGTFPTNAVTGGSPIWMNLACSLNSPASGPVMVDVSYLEGQTVDFYGDAGKFLIGYCLIQDGFLYSVQFGPGGSNSYTYTVTDLSDTMGAKTPLVNGMSYGLPLAGVGLILWAVLRGLRPDLSGIS